MTNLANESFEWMTHADEMEEYALQFFDKEEVYDELIRWLNDEKKQEFFNDFFTNHDMNNDVEVERAIRFVADNIKPSLDSSHENNAREYSEFLFEQHPELLDAENYKRFEYWHYSNDDYAIDILTDNLANLDILDCCAICSWGYDSAEQMESVGYILFTDVALDGVVVLQEKNR